MLRSLTLRNYRSFYSPASLELRPITLLLGRNSAGKSSLTRLIPLLQASLERQTSSPVLWATEIVDFGDINNVINHDHPNEPLEIEFGINPAGLSDYVNARFRYRYPPASTPPPTELRFKARLRADGDSTRYESSSILVDSDVVEVWWGEDSAEIKRIAVNGKTVSKSSDLGISARTTSLFPAIEVRPLKEVVTSRLLIRPNLRAQLSEAFEYFLHQRTTQTKRAEMVASLPFVTRSHLPIYMHGVEHVVGRRLQEAEALDRLADEMLVNDLPSIIEYCSAAVSSVLKSAGYLGPARASGARFYRIQELSVDRVDSRGANLAMYLKSLSPVELSQFNDMMAAASGYKVDIDTIPGHLSIRIGDSSGVFENLADVGFGFSQFLPIVAQIHALRQSANLAGGIRQVVPRRGGQRLIAIEQPELHLHPAFQANLADLFAAAVRTDAGSPTGLHCLIETHSETLVGGLGSLIASRRLMAADVAIYFIDKDDETKNSSVQLAEFNSEGDITNWPLGFFTAPS